MAERWLLLRGLGRESGHWGAFASQLQLAFGNHRIDTLDLPGSGVLFQQASPDRIAAITDACRQQALTDGKLTQPVNLLAISLGGMVAWDWLQRYPQEISRAVLINTSFASHSRFYQRLRWQAYQALLGIMVDKDLSHRELAIVRLVSNLPDQQRQIIGRQWAAIQQRHPVSSANLLRQIYAAARYQPDPLRPTQPVLLLNSNGDRLVAPACSQAIAAAYQLPLRTHPSAGHDLPLDDGAWVTDCIRSWMTAGDGR